MSPTPTQSQEPSKDSEQTHAAGCFMRLVWFLAGNVAMIALASGIAHRKGVFLSYLDAWFWGVVVVMAAARYVDIARLKGQTVSGQPATLKTWRRYVLLLALVTLGVWGAAHALALLR